jgi:SAM-dependent methyltransferase
MTKLSLEIPGVPFTHDGDKDRPSAQNNMRRVDIIRKFLDKQSLVLDIGKCLDIGSPNFIGQSLGIKDNTSGDLNPFISAPSIDYDFVLCSEILEHVMNPLVLMWGIYSLLCPGGICVVATPIQYAWFGFPYEADKHFVEYRPRRLRLMFEYVGFEIVKYDTYSIWKKWPFMFTGIRPFLRCLLHRSQLWLLRKPSS